MDLVHVHHPFLSGRLALRYCRPLRIPVVFATVSIGVYLLIAVAVTDAFLLWRKLKKRLVAKFGANAQVRGLAMYAVMRTFQIRRSRMPRPQVKRGEFPA